MSQHTVRHQTPGAHRRARGLVMVLTLAATGALAWMHGGRPHPVSTAATATTVAHAAATSGRPNPGLKLISSTIAFGDDSGRHGPGPQLSLAAGILVDIDTHTILWQKNPHLPHAPASTAKVLSTLVALENFAPDVNLTITNAALTQDPNETVMGLKPGQQLTVRELLTGMLTVSANDAATALAVDSVGLPAFVAAMNAQVRALGLRDSSFTTPVGLDDPDQMASAYDLAAIAAVDYDRFPLFRQLVGTRDATLPASALHPEFRLHNLNQLLDMYPAAVGIKPGYTAAAGGCLVGMAIRNGHRLIAVILGGNLVYTESRIVLDWGFTQEGLPPLLPPTPTPRVKPAA